MTIEKMLQGLHSMTIHASSAATPSQTKTKK